MSLTHDKTRVPAAGALPALEKPIDTTLFRYSFKRAGDSPQRASKRLKPENMIGADLSGDEQDADADFLCGEEDEYDDEDEPDKVD